MLQLTIVRCSSEVIAVNIVKLAWLKLFVARLILLSFVKFSISFGR